jgi:hypothetical protein
MDMGLNWRTQLGIQAAWGDGYSLYDASLQHLFVPALAGRVDVGIDHFNDPMDQSYRLVLGLGLPASIALAGNVSLITGRPYSFAFANDPLLVDSDDILTLRAGGPRGLASLGLPLGLVIQLSGDIAIDLRSGYRRVFHDHFEGTYVPLGADLLVNLVGTLDLGVGLEIPGETSAYLDRRMIRFWIAGRL